MIGDHFLCLRLKINHVWISKCAQFPLKIRKYQPFNSQYGSFRYTLAIRLSLQDFQEGDKFIQSTVTKPPTAIPKIREALNLMRNQFFEVCFTRLQLTSCNNLLQQADIRMRSHGLRHLLTTSLLQVVNSVAIHNKICYPQVYCKLSEQIVTSLRMPSCNQWRTLHEILGGGRVLGAS